MTKEQDFLNKAPEFLAAFETISEGGFFEIIECSGNAFGLKGRHEIGNIFFKAVGYIPDDLKDRREGLVSFINPSTILENIRTFIGEKGCKLKAHPTIEVTSENWPKWNRAEDKIIGSRGRVFKLTISVQFDRKE